VFSLGNFTPTGTSGPVWRTFSVANNKLQAEDVLRTLAVLPATATQQLVDDVVDLQAQYGRDDGSVPRHDGRRRRGRCLGRRTADRSRSRTSFSGAR
jgi:hypothetical protein